MSLTEHAAETYIIAKCHQNRIQDSDHQLITKTPKDQQYTMSCRPGHASVLLRIKAQKATSPGLALKSLTITMK